MPRKTNDHSTASVSLVRCAIYTRKSTEEGLEQEFNTLDAQREAAQAYILSQQQEGWVCLPDRYDDGGFTGGNVERPALQRLLQDIEAGKVDCVVVYKVDRLSRSLLDFSGMMKLFEEHQVSFVSVTQQFNTTNSMGRLILNVLLSFAQFEREIISERTRDKIAATRRKGKWSGGRPPLGFDLDRERRKLVINEHEAMQVRTIFDLYLQHEALLPVVKELEKRGWTNKRWVNRQGTESGGEKFIKTSLHRMLTNVIYLGKNRYKTEVHEGEHEAIIDTEVWNKTQAILQRNSRNGGAWIRNKFGFVLKGLLRCEACGCAMTPSVTSKRGSRRYRYYVCTNAQKRGWDKCPTKSLPANEIEQHVLEQIRRIGQDTTLLHQTLGEARKQNEQRLQELESEKEQLKKELQQGHRQLQQLSGQLGTVGEQETIIRQMADCQDRVQQLEQRLLKTKEHAHKLQGNPLDETEVEEAFRLFDPMWDRMTSQEQLRLFHLLIQQVKYHGETGRLSITFTASGIAALTQEILDQPQENIA